MYRQCKLESGGINPDVIMRTEDVAFIPCDEQNPDYQAYLAWVAEGNTILPPE